MSNFWANKFAPAAPVQQQPQQQNQGAMSPWWQGPVTVAPVQQQQQIQQPADEAYSTTKAQSARLNGSCPACFSTNYFPLGSKFSSATNKMESVNRCYDCGYPVVQQFTGAGTPSGMGGGEVSGSAKQLSSNHVVTQLENGRGSLASGNHSVIRSASEAVGHA